MMEETEIPIRRGQLWETITGVPRKAWIRSVGKEYVETYLSFSGTNSRIRRSSLLARYVLVQDTDIPKVGNPLGPAGWGMESPAAYLEMAADMVKLQVGGLAGSFDLAWVENLAEPMIRILLNEANLMKHRSWSSIDRSWRVGHLAFSIVGRPPQGFSAEWAKFGNYIADLGGKV